MNKAREVLRMQDTRAAGPADRSLGNGYCGLGMKTTGQTGKANLHPPPCKPIKPERRLRLHWTYR